MARKKAAEQGCQVITRLKEMPEDAMPQKYTEEMRRNVLNQGLTLPD